MQRGTLLRYVVAALIIAILGALAGWYMFVRNQVADTNATDTARGFGTTASFGSSAGGTYDNISGGDGAMHSGGEKITPAPRLWKITTTPVAGMGFAATSSRIYFVERATGNILIANPADSSVDRVTNTLFPKIHSAEFSGDGSVVLRFLNSAGTKTTFVGAVASTSIASSTPKGLLGKTLPPEVRATAVRPNMPQLFLISSNTDGGVTGATASWDMTGQKQIFVSALSSWQPFLLSDGSIYISQSPADDLVGYAFSIGKAGELTSLVPGGAPGLTILPKTGSTALIYGSSQNGVLSLFVKASGNAAPVRLPLRTLADKCVWSPENGLIAYCATPVSGTQGTFIENWYMGTVHTTDVWWRVDGSSGTVEKFFTTDTSISLDVEHPIMDTSGAYITFINRRDGTLWLLRIAQ